MKICDMHPVEKPRERLARLGAPALSDEELLALILRTGYAGRDVLALAQDLLRQHPRGGLARLTVADLRRRKGLGLSRASAVAAAAELGRRWAHPENGDTLEEPGRVWELLHDLREKSKEHFVALYLNARNRLVGQETVSIGTLTASLVHPREVFAPALEKRAAALIVAHNHPSGDLQPSLEDREATRRLTRAAELLGIGFLDHVVIGAAGYFSFRREGLLR